MDPFAPVREAVLQDEELDPNSSLCPSCLEISFVSEIQIGDDGTPKPVKLLSEAVSLGPIHRVGARAQQCILCGIVWEMLVKDRAIFEAAQHAFLNDGEGADEAVLRPDPMKPEAVIFYGTGVTNRLRGRIQWFNGPEVVNGGELSDESFEDAVFRNKEVASGTAIANIALAKQWLAECEAEHGDVCNGLPEDSRHSSSIDLWLLDIVDGCLVKQSTSTSRYVALSYVWGGVHMLETTKENLEGFQEPGGVLKHADKLPQTIRDTISVMFQLQERYLWVDTLSIVQDDPSQKHSQINSMDIIYSQAVMTIVAMDGTDANSGLPGVSLNERCPIRAFDSTAPVLEALCFLSKPPPLTSIYDLVPYEQRGWTLQERLLSRRRLYFTQWQLYMQCNCCIYQEDSFEPQQLEPRGTHVPGTTTKFLNLSDMQPFRKMLQMKHDTSWGRGIFFYDRLVSTYTKRKFSFQMDALNAFEGFKHIMENIVDPEDGTEEGNGIICGLPTALLGVALLWAPVTRGVERRIEFPSWSWAGWQGEAQNFRLRHGIVNDIMEFDMRLFQGSAKDYFIGDKEDWEENGTFKLLRSAIPVERYIWHSKDWNDYPILHFASSTIPARHFSLSTNPPQHYKPKQHGDDTEWSLAMHVEPGRAITSMKRQLPGIYITTEPASSFSQGTAPDSHLLIQTDTRQPVTYLRDKNTGKFTGMLLCDPGDIPADISSPRFEFVLLGATKRCPADVETETLRDIDGQNYMLQTYPSSVHIESEWWAVGVLLVEWKEYPHVGEEVSGYRKTEGRWVFAERLAVGMMYASDWTSYNPQEKYIKLA